MLLHAHDPLAGTGRSGDASEAVAADLLGGKSRYPWQVGVTCDRPARGSTDNPLVSRRREHEIPINLTLDAHQTRKVAAPIRPGMVVQLRVGEIVVASRPAQNLVESVLHAALPLKIGGDHLLSLRAAPID